MERRNQEPAPRPDLAQALSRINQGQWVQFTANGYRLFEYIQTGGTDVRSLNIDQSKYVIRVPQSEPLIQRVGATLAELFGPNDDDYRYNDDHIADKIDSGEFKSWVESLVSPEDVKKAAVRELEERRITGDEETIPCTDCNGIAHFENSCSCTHGGTTFVDMTEELEDSIVRLREDGVPDPECQTCDGTGKVQSDCPYCEGCGMTAKYPNIILINEETGEERALKFDLAALIVNGDVEVEWDGYERVYPDGFQFSQKIIRFNLSAWIDRNIAGMGIDKENAVIVRGGYVSQIESDRANVTGSRAYWQKHEGETTMRFSNGQVNMSAADVLNEGQNNLSHAYTWRHRMTNDDTGVTISDEWVMRPVRPIEDALEDLKTAIAEYGFTLGYTQSFIATGETGASFYLLDEHGGVIRQLSIDHTVRGSLENAWLAFQAMEKNISDPGVY